MSTSLTPKATTQATTQATAKPPTKPAKPANIEHDIWMHKVDVALAMSSSDAVDGTRLNPERKTIIRWDLIYLFYFIAMALTSMTLSMSTKYNRIAFGISFIHFATELIVAVHMLYTARMAKILSIVIGVIYSMEALLFAPLAPIDVLYSVFFIQFVFSDMMSALSALCVMLNDRTSVFVRNAALAILWHFIGVSLGLARLVLIYFHFVDSLQKGELWILLMLAMLFQVYYLRDALLSRFNLGRRHLISFGLGVKIGVPLIALFVTIGLAVMSVMRTSEESDDGLEVASSIWVELIAWTGWPLGALVIMFAIKFQNEGRIRVNRKK